jgi:hypothetical protein
MSLYNAATDWQYDAQEHERQQLVRDAHRPVADKLRWLEEMHHLALRMQAQQASQQNSSTAKE